MPQTNKQALSIRQPWAWLIANGYKDIENRSWNTTYRGEFFIHASKQMLVREYHECRDFVERINRDGNVILHEIKLPARDEFEFGGIIGAAKITACVTESESPWFTGKFGFVIEEPKILPFMKCQGKLQFFYPSY